MNRHVGSIRVRWAAMLLAAMGTVLVLGGCGGPMRGAYLPPPDPPPIPTRKPAPPPMAMAAQAPASAAVAIRSLGPAPARARAPATKTPSPAGAVVATTLTRGALVYRVQPGDTVYGISRRFAATLRGVIEANRLAPPFILKVGRMMRIPNPRVHTVRAGETVYGISRGYGVDMRELVRLNRIVPPYTIALGKRLVVPVWAPRPGAPAIAKAPTAPAAVQTAARSGPRPAPPPRAKSVPQAAKPVAGPVRQARIPSPPPRAGGKFAWPARGKVIARFGPKAGGLHNDGINIAAPRGAPVRAAENGVVVYRGNELRGFGNLLLIKHAGGWVTAYAHNDSFMVRRGERVRRGQVIARVGSSGNVARPQLHFEIRKGTQAVDPRRHLGPQRAVRPTRGAS